jgi:NADPH-dependent F420 reductase
MNIAIIGGTGPQGRGLALRWARAGLGIIIGSRDGKRAEAIARELAEQAGPAATITGVENSAACSAAELCVLTVPFDGQAELLKQLKPVLKPGAILVDATVPLAATVGGRPTRVLGVWQGSAAQQTAELVPRGVTVVGAFHNVSAELLSGNSPINCDVIVVSDDDNARKVVSDLAEKIPGIRAVDGGKLENARIVEQITALLITLNIRHKVHSAGIRITGLPERSHS